MAKRGSSPEAPKGNQYNKILVVLLFAMLAFNLYQQNLMSMGMYTPSNNNASITGQLRSTGLEEEDEADTIIQRSHDKSYAHILACDEGNPSGKACMKKTLDYFNTAGNHTNNIPSIPWWFQTLLRDIQDNGTYGYWHHFFTSTPAFNFCTIGKVATTEWRRVFCKLNADDCIVDPKKCGKRMCAWRTHKEMPEDAPWAVFLRDPLERLLSGYLDKCYKPKVRRLEKHCEPNAVFNPIPGIMDAKSNKYPSLLNQLEGKDKQMFAAYVDVLPLKWNVHFVPQAMFCDLHQNIYSFDFVGKMGEDFMFDLENMANQFGDPLSEVLNSSFGYLDHVNTGKKNTGRDKNQHSTHAPAKVQQFYTAQTVRRGLELLSIDYVTLGLEVPEWARQMLRNDVS